MKNHIRDFMQDESGAVTVDWVVLTAAVGLLAAATVFTVKNSAIALGPRIANELDRQMPN